MNPSSHADSSLENISAASMHPDIPATATIEQRTFQPQHPMAARSLVGLPNLPTIVATGPFDNLLHAEQLADAFTLVRQRCKAQLLLLGTGRQRTAIVRRTFAQGVGTDVQALRTMPTGRWCDIVAAADVVVPGTASGPTGLMNVLAAGRPVVAPVSPSTVRLVVPTSAGLVYRPGDVSGMAAALIRLLTSPALRHGMSCRAGEVARRHDLQKRLQLSDEGNEYA
jgi:glycosyltransferase involved in cell wall biosynthesis